MMIGRPHQSNFSSSSCLAEQQWWCHRHLRCRFQTSSQCCEDTSPTANCTGIRIIRPPLQSAFESRLGAKEDTTSTTYALRIQQINSSQTWILSSETKLLSLQQQPSAVIHLDNVLWQIFRAKHIHRRQKPVIAQQPWRRPGHCCTSCFKLQHEHWKRELAVFVTILEGAQMYCLDKLDSEKNSKEKVCKTVMLSSDKLDREYGKSGGKTIALKRPKCSHSLCDKEPDYDDNAKVNKSITKDWQANKKHLEHFNMQHSGTPCPWLQRHPIIVTTAAFTVTGSCPHQIWMQQ